MKYHLISFIWHPDYILLPGDMSKYVRSPNILNNPKTLLKVSMPFSRIKLLEKINSYKTFLYGEITNFKEELVSEHLSIEDLLLFMNL